MYVLLAERKVAVLKPAVHVLYGPYASEEEAEDAKKELASLLEPYGDTTFAIKELLSVPSGEPSKSVPVPYPVPVPYVWPYPYLPAPPWQRPWVYYNQNYVSTVSTNASPAVGLVTGA